MIDKDGNLKSNSTSNQSLSLEEQKKNETKRIKRRSLEEKFFNEETGEIRSSAIIKELIKKGMFGVIATTLGMLSYTSHTNTGKYFDEKFIEYVINNLDKIPQNELLIIGGILSTVFLSITIPLRKKYLYIAKRQRILHFADIKKYRIIHMSDKSRQIKFVLKKNESGDKGKELKDKLEGVLEHLYKKDGVVIRNQRNPREFIMKLFTEEEMSDYKNVTDMDIKKKMVLIAGGITKFKILELKESQIVFQNKQLEVFDKGELETAMKRLPQFLDKYSARLVEHGNDKIIMRFKNQIPSIDSNLEPLDPKEVFNNNSLYLGVNDIKNKTFARTSKESIRGKISGHCLIVGGSGSGKSFGFNIVMKNWLYPEAYKDIEKIYILNFKNSADFNIYKKLDKVVYSDGSVRNALKMVKTVELEMTKRYIYNSMNNHENYPGQKILFIVDEIQTISEMLSGKGSSRVEQNSWDEIESIFKRLGSKARAANISLITILQKGTVDNLPGGSSFRGNLRNRIGLKNDNMPILMDQELIEKHSIDADRLKGGQFVFMDILKGEESITEGFIQGVDLDWEKLNLSKNNDSDEDKKTVKELDKYEKVAFKVGELEKEAIEEVESEGKKTFIDNIDDLKNFEDRDFIQEAIEMLDDPNYKEEEEEKFEEVNLEELMKKVESKEPKQDKPSFDRKKAKKIVRESKKGEEPIPKKFKIDKKVEEETEFIEEKLKTKKWDINKIGNKVWNEVDDIIEAELIED